MKTLDNVRVSIRTLCIYGEQMYYFVGFLRRQKYKVKNIPKNAKTNLSEAMYQKNKNPAW